MPKAPRPSVVGFEQNWKRLKIGSQKPPGLNEDRQIGAYFIQGAGKDTGKRCNKWLSGQVVIKLLLLKPFLNQAEGFLQFLFVSGEIGPWTCAGGMGNGD